MTESILPPGTALWVAAGKIVVDTIIVNRYSLLLAGAVFVIACTDGGSARSSGSPRGTEQTAPPQPTELAGYAVVAPGARLRTAAREDERRWLCPALP